MPKLKPVVTNNQLITGYYFDCPGCNSEHRLTVRPHKAEDGASWEFDGDLERPTFLPSINDRVDFSPGSGKPAKVCHSFVTDGSIRFLSDCSHSLAGQTVELLEVKA